jgi:hypothetical protein
LVATGLILVGAFPAMIGGLGYLYLPPAAVLFVAAFSR